MISKRILTGILLTFTPLLMTAGTATVKSDQALVYNLTLAGILIVLFSLTLVALTVALMSGIIRFTGKMSRIKKEKIMHNRTGNGSEDSIPAIITALHLEMRSLQEEEKAILTIRKVIKPFSGWNNKALVMRNPEMK
jgi:Na+-transporting methylmalonyl-CoA/oxaloacetate decarboxylase gamma subunit